MVNVSEKVIATVRKFEDEKDFNDFLSKIERLYKFKVRRFRFNLGKCTNMINLEDTCEAILKMKSCFSDIKVMVDIGYPGTGVRINLLPGEYEKELVKNEEILFVSSEYVGEKSNNIIFLNSNNLFNLFLENKIVYYRDGESAFIVKRILSKDKAVALPMDNIKIETNQSLKCCSYIKENNVNDLIREIINSTNPEEIALSFVEKPEDVMSFKMKFPQFKSKIISKIETSDSVHNLKNIIDISDSIMVARGDLAFNSDLSDLYFYQNKIIKETRQNKKEVYVATDILGSLSKKAFPSRSDVIDLASIISQDVSGIILNGPLVVSRNIGYALELIEEMFNKNANGKLSY
ncbi:pyruvate kinase [Clostridium butanoliproducens]|uniref:pyruvate kinase n=1 Tax=Clostridium butanoliproducens TaxID=2991837 RepID=UPI0024BA6BB1|nr:pyruvate kinase [Clostridium butanoliproducens]